MTIPIYVDNPDTWEKIQVPYDIVKFCSDYTQINPHDPKTSTEELRLVDCYWYQMGFYGLPPGFFHEVKPLWD